jgi:hypothetical protein
VLAVGIVGTAVALPVATVPDAVVLADATVPRAVMLAAGAVPGVMSATLVGTALVGALLVVVIPAFGVSVAPPPPQAASSTGRMSARSAANLTRPHGCPSALRPVTMHSPHLSQSVSGLFPGTVRGSRR